MRMPDLVGHWRYFVNALPEGKPRAVALRFARIQFPGKDSVLRFVAANDRAVRHQFVDGPVMIFDLRDPSQNAMFYEQFEPTERELLNLLLRPGDVALDVGAHVGFHTLFMARSVGSTGSVHAFEPLPTNFVSLERNIRANQFHHVYANHVAVSDQSGSVDLFVPKRRSNVYGEQIEETWHSSLASIIATSVQEDVYVEQISAIALDDYLRDHRVQRVHLMKLDIEGAEPLALRGMEQTLSGAHPPRILCEVSAARLERCGFGAQAVHQMMHLFGYQAFHILRSSLVKSTGPSNPNALSENFLFVHQNDPILAIPDPEITFQALRARLA